MPELILASTSPYRRDLLLRLGVPFRCQAPGVDEASAIGELRDPEAIARTLAKAKALAVARQHPEAIVIGSDQVCALGDRIFGKPGSSDQAVAQLLALQGREHRLLTAVVVAHRGELHRHLDVTTLQMRALEPAEVQRYVAADQPFDCAGSYRIEARGIALFTAIHSHDHSAIIGLPLLATCETLRRLGVAVP